jgi:alkylhydroperoxidase family enzyme
MGWKWNGGFDLRTAADTDGATQRVLTKLEATGQAQTILRLAANSPTVFRPFVLLANALVNNAALGAAEREALVLYLATKEGAAYEWDAHQVPAEKAGLTAEQVEVLGAGEALRRPDVFSDEQNLALRLGDQLVEGHPWSDADWAAAIGAWSADGALDLVFSVSWWAGFVLLFTRALDLRPSED